MNNRLEISCYDKISVNADDGYSFEEIKAKKYFIKAHHYKFERYKKNYKRLLEENSSIYNNAIKGNINKHSGESSQLSKDIQNQIKLLINNNISILKSNHKSKLGSQQAIEESSYEIINKEVQFKRHINGDIKNTSHNGAHFKYNHSNNLSSPTFKTQNSGKSFKVETINKISLSHNLKQNSSNASQSLFLNDSLDNVKSFEISSKSITKKSFQQKENDILKVSLVKEDPFDKELKTRILQAFQDYKFINHNFPTASPPTPLTKRIGYYLFGNNLLKYRSYSKISSSSWTEKIRNGLSFKIDINNSHKEFNKFQNGNHNFVHLHFEKLLGEGAFAKVYQSSLKQPLPSHDKNDDYSDLPPQFIFPLNPHKHPLARSSEHEENGKVTSIFTHLVQKFQNHKRKRAQFAISSEDEDYPVPNGADLVHPNITNGNKRIKSENSSTDIKSGEHGPNQSIKIDDNLLTSDKEVDPSCTIAVKVQSPKDTNWEFYIYSEIIRRLALAHKITIGEKSDVSVVLSNNKFFPKMYGAFVYLDVSILLLELYPSGTLLNLVNVYKSKGSTMPEALVLYFTSEILTTLLYLHHRCKILHTDIKPDNFLLGDLSGLEILADKMEDCPTTLPLPTLEDPLSAQQNFTLKLTDFGKSIDLELYPMNTYFAKRNEDVDFQCPEMLKGLPWNYHLDCFGAVGTVHCMVFNEYMKIHKDKRGSSAFKISKSLKRGWSASNSDMWKDFFDIFLNLDPSPETNDHVTSAAYFRDLLSDWRTRFLGILSRDVGPIKFRAALRTIPRPFTRP